MLRRIILAFPLFFSPAFSTESAEQNPPKKIDTTVLRVPPKTPKEERDSFLVMPGFSVELVASEPLVQSPMFVEFDEDGRLWVIELPEYNAYAATKPQGRGRIIVLTDTNGDGEFDKRTVFADNLDYPTGLACWKGGVYVGVAPDLLYLKDTDGDGKADLREVILTGFGKDKAGEAHLNSFRWTPEQRLLISTGMNGGEISMPSRPDLKSVSVRNLNILLDPRNNSFEITSGGGQHGMSLDDWGNVFVCGNSDPIQMLMYDARYLARNPTVIAPQAAMDILPSGKFTKLNRISETEPWRRVRTELRKSGIVPGYDEGGTPSGFFTGATGITVYRGDAFGEEFYGNVFVGEVANNLVFRAKLKEKGVGYEAVRAQENQEFLASKDVWFRPAQMANGPDGCLYIVDMYRELIEGAAFLPPQVLSQIDPSAGFDKGRIWRVVPDRFKKRPEPELSKLKSSELVALLKHPNGWHRDVASRLLTQRNDRSVIDELKKIVADTTKPASQILAMYLLDNFKVKLFDISPKAIAAFSPKVREHLLTIYDRSGGKLDIRSVANSPFSPAEFNSFFKDGHRDQDRAYRHRFAFVSGWQDYQDRSPAVYVQLAFSDAGDPWMRLAILAGQNHSGKAKTFTELVGSREFCKRTEGRTLLIEMAAILGTDPTGDQVPVVLKGMSTAAINDSALARDLYKALRSRASNGSMARLTDPNISKGVKSITDRLLGEAVVTARDQRKSPAVRAAAVRDLTMAPLDDALPILRECLQPTQPTEVQKNALETLGIFGGDSIPSILLEHWKGLSPSVRPTATEVFLSRADWVNAFLDAVESKKIARSDVEPSRVELIKKSPTRAIGVRATKLFGVTNSDRQKVFEEYRKALPIKGNVAKGKLVFKNNCAACHRLEGIGENVGADLMAIRDRGLESVLLNIIDPNREVKPQYLTYAAELKSGRLVTGMISQETATSLTIRKPDGSSESIARNQIDQLRSSGLSYMPEGLEKQIDLSSMADLLAYLSSVK